MIGKINQKEKKFIKFGKISLNKFKLIFKKLLNIVKINIKIKKMKKF